MASPDLAADFTRLLAVGSNSTQTGSYASVAPTTTDPAGAGVLATGTVAGVSNSLMLFCPFGIGANATTFKMLLVGWRKAVNAGSTNLFVACPLAQFLCTLSTAAGCTGVASSAVLATEFFCDTISLTGGNSNVDCKVTSPATFTTPLAGSPGYIEIDVQGYLYVQPLFDRNGSATSANTLYAPLR